MSLGIKYQSTISGILSQGSKFKGYKACFIVGLRDVNSNILKTATNEFGLIDFGPTITKPFSKTALVLFSLVLFY